MVGYLEYACNWRRGSGLGGPSLADYLLRCGGQRQVLGIPGFKTAPFHLTTTVQSLNLTWQPLAVYR